jgi:hypothetical protein
MGVAKQALLTSALLLCFGGTAHAACNEKEDAKDLKPGMCRLICRSSRVASFPSVRIDVIPDPEDSPGGKDCAAFFMGRGMIKTPIGELPIFQGAAPKTMENLIRVLGKSAPELTHCGTPRFEVDYGEGLFACNITPYPLRFSVNHPED